MTWQQKARISRHLDVERRTESAFIVREHKEELDRKTEPDELSHCDGKAREETDRKGTSGVKHNRHWLLKRDHQQGGHCVTRAAVRLPEPLL